MLTAMVVDDDEPCPDKEGGFDHVLFLFLPPPSSSTPPSPAPASPAPPPSSLFLSFFYPMRLMTRSKPERGGSHNAAGRLMAAAAAASLRSFKKNERREDTKERTDEYQEEERTVREQEETSIKVGWSGLAWLGALVEFEAVEAGRRRRALRVIWRRSRPLDMSLPNAAAAASNWHQSLSLFLSLSLSLSLSLYPILLFFTPYAYVINSLCPVPLRNRSVPIPFIFTPSQRITSDVHRSSDQFKSYFTLSTYSILSFKKN